MTGFDMLVCCSGDREGCIARSEDATACSRNGGEIVVSGAENGRPCDLEIFTLEVDLA